MSIGSYIEKAKKQEFEALESRRESDKAKAQEGRTALEKVIKDCFPKFYEEIVNSITGTAIVRFRESGGGIGEGATALILEDKYMIYIYRSSQCRRIAISLEPDSQGFHRGKSFACAITTDPAYNDREWAKVLENALSEFGADQAMRNAGYGYKIKD